MKNFGRINAVAFVLCIAVAVLSATLGNYGWLVANLVMAGFNFPFAIRWLHTRCFKGDM